LPAFLYLAPAETNKKAGNIVIGLLSGDSQGIER